mmetsp:Transcript_6383/g.11671  ORF Transcript_6383/g.11671 Transcript_6383/m.11671 type:complete len:879 (-) Transcript_6383:104-2740(-)
MANQGIPRCTCFLFVAAITCHTLVLVGNISTALMLKNLGGSAGGWGNVAFSVTHALDTELNPAMAKVTQLLTSTVQAATSLNEGLDTALSVTGSTVDTAMKHYDGSDGPGFKVKAMAGIEQVAHTSMGKVKPLVHALMEDLSPALSQVGEWLGGFSAKTQDTLEEFGTVTDRAQKLIDQVMAQVSSTGGMYEEMVWDTYHIFDPYDDGIDVKELQQAADQYGITALQGQKAQQLMKKYNTDGKGGIDIHEYEGLVTDPSLPGLMTTILRTYSNKLSGIGSSVKVAKMRAEVAEAVVDYLTLVCSKNLTKVGWVTSRLVDGSLPLEFTADVFYELYKSKVSPDNLSPIDVGSLMVNYTLKYNARNVIAALDLLATTNFFASEGFDISIEDETVEQVVEWIEMAEGGEAALKAFAKVTPSSASESWADAYDQEVKKREVQYSSANGLGSPETTSYHTQAASTLRDILLGGSAASAGSKDPDAAQVSGSAQPAKPETLAFARELSENVSQSVKDYNEETHAYSGTSSNPLDSICNSINGMVKKTQSFLTLMDNYAGPGGAEFIEKQADQFVNGTLEDIVLLSGELIDEGINSFHCSAGNKTACKQLPDTDYTLHLSGASTFVTDTMKDLQAVLPQVIKALTTAKKEVSTISGVINSISQMLSLKAPPLMENISQIYKYVWIGYFTFFFLFSASMLYYGFWANGWFGGPQAELPDTAYEAPQTFTQRLRTCCGSCLACMRSCTSGHLCFWSMLLLAQLIILILFVVSLLICILTGIQAFFGAGCSKIYLIGDAEVCTAVMSIFKGFLKTFGFSEPIEDTCLQKNLLTCKIIRDSVFHTAIGVIVGALLASVFSFQMLLDSATKHERARCAKMWEEEGLKKEE